MGNTVKAILMILAVFLAIAFIHAQKSHPFDEHIKWLTENSEFEYNGEDYPDISYHSSQKEPCPKSKHSTITETID